MMNALSAGKDDREGTESKERDGVERQEETVEAKVEIDG